MKIGLTELEGTKKIKISKINTESKKDGKHSSLLRFEKGELLTQPLESLRQFLIVERGSVQIYGIDENNRGYSIAISGSGTLLGDVEDGIDRADIRGKSIIIFTGCSARS